MLEAKIWIGPDGGFTTPVNGDPTGSGGETAQQLGRTRARAWAGRTGSAGRSEYGCRLTCFFCISGVLGSDHVETCPSISIRQQKLEPQELFALGRAQARDGFPDFLLKLAKSAADAPGCSPFAAG